MRPRPTATLAMAAVLAWTATAKAQVDIPSAANSTIGPFVRIVGVDANGVPDPRGAFTVVLRDASHNPMPGFSVWIRIDGCGELKGCTNAFGACSQAIAQATTNALGVATLIAVGGRGAGPVALPNCAEIVGQGVPLGHRSASAFDLDGVNGVNLIDASWAYADLVSGTYFARSDYDADGDLDLIDLSVLMNVAYGGGSTHSCPTGICP